MNIAYGRISDEKQNLDRQYDWFKENGIPDENIYMEAMSGTIKHRPELDKVKNVVREGDNLYIESLTRLGRSTKDLLSLIEYFDLKKVRIVSQKENVDTSTPTGKMITQLMCVLSEFERDLMFQRTKAGMESARARGKWGGRAPKSKKDIETAIKMYDEKDDNGNKKWSISEICKATSMTNPTLYKYINARNDGTLNELIKMQDVRRQEIKKENRRKTK